MTALAQLLASLGDIPVLTDPVLVKQKSRDFYWYSPVLKRQLRNVTADAVVMPRSEAEVIAIVKACYAQDIPITVRAGASGNYGQAMPLKGGVLMDMSLMNQVLDISFGRVRAQAGTSMLDLDRKCQADTRQEVRFHPSTRRIGSIGGFVAGGSGGVGSAAWGGLRDHGNVLGARVVTMEAEPRVIELRGVETQKIIHAYGTNGIITEVEMPLVPAYPWVDLIIGFDDFMSAARFAHTLTSQDGLIKKLVTVVADPIGQKYFKPLQPYLPAGKHLVLTMIAEHAMEAFEGLLAAWPGQILYRCAGDQPNGDIPPLYEFSWNHTTLQTLKVRKSVTYMQTLFPPPHHLALVEKMMGMFSPDEIDMHLEFVRFDGQVTCFGLQMVEYRSDERLQEIMDIHEANGCPMFNPHTITLEEGGMKQVDAAQLAFKREADPKGLLNPGKMLAWDDPDYAAKVPQGVHLFPAGAGR